MNHHIINEVVQEIKKCGFNRVGIVGSRDFPAIHWLEYLMCCLHTEIKGLEIISGGGGLIDLTAAKIAREYGIEPIEYFPEKRYLPNGQLDKRVYLERNELIAGASQCGVAFYKGVGYRHSGCLNFLEHLSNKNKKGWVITP